MDSDLNTTDDPAEPAAAADWVMELLRSEWPQSPGFEQRCYQAVDQAWQLGRLRRQAEMAGEFIPRPVSDYLRSLAAAARVPLDGVIKWAGLPADLRPGDALASGWGRIARALGLGLARRSCPIASCLPGPPVWSRRCCWSAAGRTYPAGRRRSTIGIERWPDPYPPAGSRCSIHSAPPRR